MSLVRLESYVLEASCHGVGKPVLDWNGDSQVEIGRGLREWKDILEVPAPAMVPAASAPWKTLAPSCEADEKPRRTDSWMYRILIKNHYPFKPVSFVEWFVAQQ